MKKQSKILRIILFLAFMFFGLAKIFVSPEQTTDVFGQIGGAVSQYLTGIYQIISAILILIPSTIIIGAWLMIVSMIVAILLHIFLLGFQGPFLFLTIIAIVIIILAVMVLKNNKKK